ncbi:hypothetical protein KFL_007570010 [Klebsormidium nitens]|uniref:RRM domain-containing protein n=1 Tax=Klebsormidium nitens TaxID=105231 RepID=A0A1Y1ISW7_KLENI|nr:hypothetical protein KFL_007570010 [Klebsormidium nitens]|eukprot:GAQ91278.1 hypothetical protein KFL_007570010 [Klebsormidium nitens]
MADPTKGVFYSRSYHPIQAGSIDGTDTEPHDRAISRALVVKDLKLYHPEKDVAANKDPFCVIFVGRLAEKTTETTLHEVASRYGRVRKLRIVRHIVTGASRRYAFVEYESEEGMRRAYRRMHREVVDGSQILVDYTRQQLMPGWIPRRLGGGLSGFKESGQLRFGGRDKPFRAPLRPIPKKQLSELGIDPPPEGRYLYRSQTPPLPHRTERPSLPQE